MSEWDDTTREAAANAVARAQRSGLIQANSLADAVLAVVDAVPRAEHERVVAEMKAAHKVSARAALEVQLESERTEHERLRQAIRDLAKFARDRADLTPKSAWSALDHTAAQLRQLVDGGQS